MDEKSDIHFTYRIKSDQKILASFDFVLDNETLFLKNKPQLSPPPWSKLDYHKCEHCPLSSKDTPYCPVAKNISPITEAFKDLKSYMEVSVEVISKERTYFKKTSLQEVIASMIGIPMATSGCPHMNFLRLMARYHLPFSSSEETYIRLTSLSLLRKHIVSESKSEEISLKDLESNYENVKKVNLGIVERIRSLGSGDADPNAIVLLHYLADNIQHMVVNSSEVNKLHKLISDTN